MKMVESSDAKPKTFRSHSILANCYIVQSLCVNFTNRIQKDLFLFLNEYLKNI